MITPARRPALLVLLAAACACGAHAIEPPPVSTGIVEALATARQSAAQDRVERGRLEALQAVYLQRGFAPFWSRDGVPTVQAITLIQTLRSADSYGLRPEDYAGLLASAASLPPTMGSSPRASVGPEFDLALSRAALKFLTDIHFGRVSPRPAGFNLEYVRPPLDPATLLSQLAAANDPSQVIASVEPQFYHYQLLKGALVRYRRLAAGTIAPTQSEKATAPYARRIRQIELTLERWRWLPAFTRPPLIVNIPQFRLFAFQSTRDRKAEILQMDVIVGRTYPRLQTPVFAADMRYVIFRPYWDVPFSIMTRELLPEIRAKPDYLRKQHLEIVRGSGNSIAVLPPTPESFRALAAGAARLRQQPGEDNALGLIKFMLPNAYNVYLHSTPAHQLFSRPRRAFSHGCIRVSDPVGLASYVLRNAPGNWTIESIRAAMNGTASLQVTLTKPIPVLILYGTALAMEDGTVQFFEDIYGNDRKLEKLLGLAPVAGK